MRNGKMLKSGDVILTSLQFADTFEIKKRPALILFEEYDNIVVAGITSNKDMKGIKISKKDGALKDSIIKTNYLFTISREMVFKKLFHLNREKKLEVFDEITKKICQLTN